MKTSLLILVMFASANIFGQAISNESSEAVGLTSNSKIFAYPNPVKDILNIPLGDNETSNVTLSVYDLTGRMIKANVISATNNTLQINVSELQPGVYIYRIDTPSGTLASRFVKK